MKRVMVTGGSGFIGSHVVDKLQEQGIETHVLDLRQPLRKDVTWHPVSLLESNDLAQAVKQVDAVIHLAAIADVRIVQKDPALADQVNVRGTLNLLEAARQCGGKRIVYAGTTWVYNAAREDNVDESTPLGTPNHLYTATKLAGENYCLAYSELYDLPVTILRYGIPYGPRAREGTVIALFVGKAMRGEPLTIAGDGSQYRNFVYVEDLAEGNVMALDPVATNKIYNLDGQERISIRQIADTVQSLVGNVAIEYIPARVGDFSGKNISSRRALDELGWQPKVSFQQGMKNYLAWWKSRQPATTGQ